MATVRTNVSADVLNRIRESASVDYRKAVPLATADAECIKDIGAVIVDSPNLQNEFINTLINRIGKVIIESRLYESPLKMFNKGSLDFGETIEMIFTDICKPYQFSESKAEQDIYKRVIPNVRTAFACINSELFYKQTISEVRIRRAFTSIDGVESLIRDITSVMLTSSNYDEYLIVKYLIAKSALDGTCTIQNISSITDKATADNALTYFREYSNNFEFLGDDYNIMGVHTHTSKDNQYLIMNNHNDAFISVNSLAYMFNMSESESGTHKVRVDNFNKFDIARLTDLLGLEEGETPFTTDELTALANIEGVLLDENFLQIYYAYVQNMSKWNEEGLYYNVWLHKGTVYGRSPFANIVIFAHGTNGVTSVEIDDAELPTVTHGVKGSGEIDCDITISGLKPKFAGVLEWSVVTSGTGTVSIDENGVLSWGADLSASDTITITVKSVADSTKTDTATITVA